MAMAPPRMRQEDLGHDHPDERAMAEAKKAI
jgi:hypothetical protein